MARSLPDPTAVKRFTRAVLKDLVDAEAEPGPGGKGQRVPPAGRERMRQWMHLYFTQTEQGRQEWRESWHCRQGRTLDAVLDDLMMEVP